jgi:hypothetical protein
LLLLEKAEKAGEYCGAGRVKMQVGYKQCCHGRRKPPLTRGRFGQS